MENDGRSKCRPGVGNQAQDKTQLDMCCARRQLCCIAYCA